LEVRLQVTSGFVWLTRFHLDLPPHNVVWLILTAALTLVDISLIATRTPEIYLIWITSYENQVTPHFRPF